MIQESRRRLVKTRRSLLVIFIRYLKVLIPLSVVMLSLSYLAKYNGLLLHTSPNLIYMIYQVLVSILTLKHIREYLDEVHIVGSNRLLIYYGLFHLKPKKISMSYSDIEEINIKPINLGFKLDCANIEIIRKDGSVVLLNDIENPEAFSSLLLKLSKLPAESCTTLLKPRRLRKSRFKVSKKIERKKNFFAA